MRKTLLFIAVAASLSATPSRAQSRMDLEALGRMVRIADPQIAPDGRSIAITVSRANFEENRYDTDVVMVEVLGDEDDSCLELRPRGDEAA